MSDWQPTRFHERERRHATGRRRDAFRPAPAPGAPRSARVSLLGPALATQPAEGEGQPVAWWELVRAPCCRRTVQAEMLHYVGAALPDAARAALGGAEYCCDGCRERLFRLDLVDEPTYWAALGAPPAVVAEARARHQAMPGLPGDPARVARWP